MGIILIMAVQMIPVTESSVQVSNAEQYGYLPLPIDVAGSFEKACALSAFLFRLMKQERWHMSLGWTSMQRDRQPEVMDQPGLDPVEHDRALQGLRRINGISRCVPGLFRQFESLACENPSTQLSVLELACGGGDTAIELAALARRRDLNLSFQACDLNPEAVRIARRNVARSDSCVGVFVADALDPSASKQFDVVYCTLFAHHLDPPDVVRLLTGMAARARQLVIVDDLIRSRLGYSLAWMGTRLLSRSWVVHHDGPLSVKAAFTPTEILDLASQAGLRGCVLERTWPERYRLCWRPH